MDRLPGGICSLHNFGAAASASKLLMMDTTRITHALGVSGHLSQVLTGERQSLAENRAMTKYGVPGWQNTGALWQHYWQRWAMPEITTVLDSEQGFWKFAGL